MRIEKRFVVSADPDRVWTFFQDVPEVARCLPGAELTEDRGDGTYAGKVSVALGPMTATFEGEATVTPDPETRTGRIEGKGVDRRGGSRGQVKVVYRLEPEDGGTAVSVDADITLAGPAAQFGRTGLIEEMSNRLISEFVDCLERKLQAATPEAAAEVQAGEVRGFTLLLKSLWALVVRFVRRLLGREQGRDG